MSESRKKIFLTGATGNMGRATLDELLQRGDRFEVITLVLPTAKDRRIITPYQEQGVEVVWGNLTNYEDVLEGVSEADIILHVGGLVSPLADTQPELTMKVNVGAAQNIVRAIQSQPDPDRINLVYIGSVAQTGNRPVPIHWGRVGDPIKISTFDTYALSKTTAERIIIDSGLKNWVSLRQTGIARMAAAETLDPITFHTTLDGVLEWITPKDSGRLLANVCEDSVPESFWGNIYNIGGGAPNRLTNLELFEKMLGVTGVKDYREVLEPNWFALKNFHGQWFSDSDLLEAIVPYRNQTIDEYLDEQKPQVPWYIQLGSALPKLVRRKFEQVARGPRGTLSWLAQGDIAHIKAYFGSFQIWKTIRGWDTISKDRPAETAILLEHGYDEKKSPDFFSIQDAWEAAQFRGGECLSQDMDRGDWRSLLRWRCHAGHEFPASLNLILKGGHWCPECMGDPTSYSKLAQHSSFFQQVWEPDLQFG
ncbi:MAG: NAD(P)-dependent oxidoreductase [Anaerolineales bacterium]|nr:NAD(P)-dependent oxidoreductase [Anaerolineales bacterium]